jgi:3-methyladenine DNA glycosylase/8-oxoguanine DNA glycosylase
MPKTPDYKAAVEHLKSSDAKLRKLIEKVGEPTIKLRHSHTIFYALMRAIIYQQLAGAAASAIMGRVEALADGYEMTPEQLLSLPDERLRGAGLSKNKMAALRDLAAKVLDGTVPTAREMSRMDEEEIIERITQVRGIGRWTVEMLLIFRLGKMDILPLDDFGVRKGFQKAYKLKDMPTKKELAARGARWSPWRSVASWYLWRSCEMKDAKPAKVKKAAKVLTS